MIIVLPLPLLVSGTSGTSFLIAGNPSLIPQFQAKYPPWTLGMTEDDAKMLYKTMEELYNQYIEHVVKENPNAFDKPKKNKSRFYQRKQ